MLTNVILGWLLGLLSIIIIDLNRDRRQKREIEKGIRIELLEIKQRIVGSVYLIASQRGKYDRDLLKWIDENYTDYIGTYVTDNTKKTLKDLIQMSDEELELLSKNPLGWISPDGLDFNSVISSSFRLKSRSCVIY